MTDLDKIIRGLQIIYKNNPDARVRGRFGNVVVECGTLLKETSITALQEMGWRMEDFGKNTNGKNDPVFKIAVWETGAQISVLGNR